MLCDLIKNAEAAAAVGEAHAQPGGLPAAGADDHPEVRPRRLRHPLKFSYLLQEVTLHLGHCEFELESLLVTLEHKSESTHLSAPAAMAEQEDKTFKLGMRVADVLADTLCVSLEQPQPPGKPPLPHPVLSIELVCFNLDVYQTIDSSVDLLNTAFRLRRARREEDADRVSFHVAMIAKHRSKWVEAQETLKAIARGPIRRDVLLNLADCAVDTDEKLRYLAVLAQSDIQPNMIFKRCRDIVELVGRELRVKCLMSCATYLSLMTFLLHEVGCSIADSLVCILRSALWIAQQKKQWKQIKA